MMSSLFQRTKNIISTLRFSILSIFISLFIAAMLMVIGISYWRFSNAISFVAFKLMDQAATLVYNDIVNEMQAIAFQCDFAARLARSGVINLKNQPVLTQYTFDFMNAGEKLFPIVQSISWSDEAGNMTISARVNDGSIATEVINRSQIPATHKNIIRNLNEQVTQIVDINNFTYDPRIRPWYIYGKKFKKSGWSDVVPLQLVNTGYIGLVTAAPILDQQNQFVGLIAMTLRLDYLRKFIESRKVSKHGLVFIINTAGEIISFPNVPQSHNASLMKVSSLSMPWVVASFQEYQKNKQHDFIYKFNNETYLASYRAIPFDMPHPWFVAVITPEQDFVANLVKTNMLVVAITFLILAAGIYLMSKLVNRIVVPIRDLVTETIKIKNFKLTDTGRVHSHILEINALSDALHTMKNGLRSFQKYVPAALVRKLIESGKDVIRGGEKKPLAIFFSDIQDFTEIAEKTDPSYLMEHLCEYFNEISHLIDHAGGTIDKYIGDSVMAFWGAPLSKPLPCQHAAQAALAVMTSLKDLNSRWQSQGKPPLYTRIGLHYGEAIVGNVGSEERLNYTVIGDAINMTSRLESINKVYKTNIIVSETFYELIKDTYILRFIDCIAVKGKKQSVRIYELLSENKNQLSYDINLYTETFGKAYLEYQGQRWDAAIQYFEECLRIYPLDSLAVIFIERCHIFEVKPPADTWDGIWRMSEK
jgi:adenylate cyclase